MILWGSGTDQSVLGKLESQPCDSCARPSEFTAFLPYTYRHLWFILSFVSDKTYYAICDNCGSAITMGKKEGKQIFPHDRIPFIRKNGWILGAVAVCLLVVTSIIDAEQENTKNAEYLAFPQVNDHYMVDLTRIGGSGYHHNKSIYGALMVAEVNSGTLTFAVPEEGWTRKSDAEEQLRKKADGLHSPEETLSYSSEEITQMYQQKIIYKIIRQ